MTRAPGTLRPPVIERRALRRTPPWVPAIAAIAAIGAATWAIFSRAFLNYDTLYMLVWGRDLIHGRSPDYDVTLAPTPHPLSIAWSTIGLPFGDSAGSVMVIVALLGFGALVWIIFRLGQEVFSPWVGAVAAVVVLTRPAIMRDAILGYQDVPFSALVIGAVLLEARKPRRGTAVLVCLGLAGLLRPEAWVLSGLYVLYLWPGVMPRERWKFSIAACVPGPQMPSTDPR